MNPPLMNERNSAEKYISGLSQAAVPFPNFQLCKINFQIACYSRESVINVSFDLMLIRIATAGRLQSAGELHKDFRILMCAATPGGSEFQNVAGFRAVFWPAHSDGRGGRGGTGRVQTCADPSSFLLESLENVLFIFYISFIYLYIRYMYRYRIFLEKHRIFLKTLNPNKKTQNPEPKTLNFKPKKKNWEKSGISREKSGFAIWYIQFRTMSQEYLGYVWNIICKNTYVFLNSNA